VTKEQLNQRITELGAGMIHLQTQMRSALEGVEKIKANMTMTSGAMEECKFWLAKLEEAEPQKPPNEHTFGKKD